MKNKQPNLSRRTVLGGSLAALSVFPALTTTAAPGVMQSSWPWGRSGRRRGSNSDPFARIGGNR